MYYPGEYCYAQADETSSPTSYSYRFEQRVCEVSLGNLQDLDITREFRDTQISSSKLRFLWTGLIAEIWWTFYHTRQGNLKGCLTVK